MRRVISIPGFVFLSVVLLPLGAEAQARSDPSSPDGRLSRDRLVADVRELADRLVAVHPDPFTAGGGTIAFYRRLHRLLAELPAEGLTRAELHARLQPFLAAHRDGHTYLLPLDDAGQTFGTGYPVRFTVLARDSVHPEDGLFVEGIAGVDDPSLVGARVIELGGVPLERVIERQRRWRGYANEFGNLRNLLYNLQTAEGIEHLLPEATDGGTLGLTVLPPGASTPRELVLEPGDPPAPWDASDARLTLPASRAGEPAWSFIDEAGEVAVLRLDNTWGYREYFEPTRVAGQENGFMRSMGAHLYGAVHPESDPPEDFGELVDALPSSTDLLTELARAMRSHGTRRLVVDVRRNPGGSSTIVDQLLYFLGGRDAWRYLGEAYQIERLTDEDIAEDGDDLPYPRRPGEYDFTREDASRAGRGIGNEEYYLEATPTFAAELERGTHEGYYRPPELVVVTSPVTFSGGFWVVAALEKLGATIVGVPSGQEGNHFADTQTFELTHSGIGVGVSSRYFVMFPDRPDGMRVLPVDLPLTYERWAEWGFDPNAAVMLGVEGGVP